MKKSRLKEEIETVTRQASLDFVAAEGLLCRGGMGAEF